MSDGLDRIITADIPEELYLARNIQRWGSSARWFGSLGEAAGEALFDIALGPASSPGYDAVAGDGRKVELKATYGNSIVAIRPTSHDCAAGRHVIPQG